MTPKPKNEKKRMPPSSPTSCEPSSATPGDPCLPAYTPPPAPAPVASTQEPTGEEWTPLPLPSEMVEKPSSSSSKIDLPKPGLPVAVRPPTSPRPLAAPVLGGKALVCFLWSAAHDDDAEFLRRYGARVKWMHDYHGDNAQATAALVRLASLA